MKATKASQPREVNVEALRAAVADCDVLVVAAGFEERARRLLELIGPVIPRRVVAVRYPEGAIAQNDAMLAHFRNTLNETGEGVVEIVLDARRPDDYVGRLKEVFRRWRPDTRGEVWVDISALPMQGICATLVGVREMLPGTACRVVYTEAEEYYPREEQARDTGERRAPGALSKEMSTNLIPKRFSGAASEVLTCLVVFAGYEAHRSLGVVEELNPSKLVLVFGQPDREDRNWRLEWSKRVHGELKRTRPTANEIVSTLNPVETLELLSTYYDYLFADHNLAVAPICSKMQLRGLLFVLGTVSRCTACLSPADHVPAEGVLQGGRPDVLVSVAQGDGAGWVGGFGVRELRGHRRKRDRGVRRLYKARMLRQTDRLSENAPGAGRRIVEGRFVVKGRQGA